MAAILFGWMGLSEPLWYCITKLSTSIVDQPAGAGSATLTRSAAELMSIKTTAAAAARIEMQFVGRRFI
jgi:hypothetical protein